MPNTTKQALFTNKQYDLIKHIVQVVLPAAATLYLGLSDFWNLPNPLAVVGTITLLTTFLGVTLGISNKSYDQSASKYDGTLVIDTTDPEKDLYSLEVDVPITELDKKNQVLVRVSHK